MIMQRPGSSIWMGFGLSFSCFLSLGASLPGRLDADGIIDRMSEVRSANRAQRRPFEVVRNYRLFGKQMDTPVSEVTARVSYFPPQGQSFTIHKEQGTGLGETIVRRILEHEKLVLADQA